MPTRGVAFRLESDLPSQAELLMEDFRLAVNNAVRVGLQARVTSRNALAKLAYKDFRCSHPGVYAQHLVSAFEVAAGIMKAHRRRLRRSPDAPVPYVRRLMMKAENQAYRLDRVTGTIDLPIRAGCHVKLKLVVSRYHRRYLDDPALTLGSLTVLPDRVIVTFRKETPKPYRPESILSLDTNECSLDGIFVEGNDGRIVNVDYHAVTTIQQRHHDRRKRLQKKKAHDRRTSRALCKREGRREHHRVGYRMHQVANSVLEFAESKRSAIVLEDLKGMRFKRNKAMNRRLSMWPRRKLHQIIEYKAAWRGIPVMKVDPGYSSKRCPICGSIQDSRMGTVFECECGWRLDRHINASINLLQTAVSKGLGVAGGLRFDPGAFQHDVMMALCDPARGARPELNGTRCVQAVT